MLIYVTLLQKESLFQWALQRGMQPLLLVALSLRYARTIKGPACFLLRLCVAGRFLSGDDVP